MRLLNEMLTKSDEIGAAINSRLGLALLNNRGEKTKDLWEANFHCNVTTPVNLVARFNITPGILDPKDEFLYFMCLSGKLEPERMVEYINDLCDDILPFKINVDDVIYLGKFKSSKGYRGSKDDKYDIYLIKTGINQYINSYYRYILKKFLIDDLKEQYKSNMFNVYYGNTRELSPVLSKIKRFNNSPSIKHDSKYFMIVDTLGNLSDDVLMDIYNKIESNLEVQLGDIFQVGELNTINPKTKEPYYLDVFVIEHNEK